MLLYGRIYSHPYHNKVLDSKTLPKQNVKNTTQKLGENPNILVTNTYGCYSYNGQLPLVNLTLVSQYGGLI